MESFLINHTIPKTLNCFCCVCSNEIEPNSFNMCINCIKSRVNINADISKQNQLYSCRNCERFLLPPNTWVKAELESKELLSICLKRIKSSLSKVRLVGAIFVWKEPHSKQVAIKLTIEKEVFDGAVIQNTFTVNYTICNQMCDECHRIEAKDYWRACVQIRQKCDFKKTLFYMEQLILKHNAQKNATNIKPGPTGIDFYFLKQQDARKMVDFINGQLPCKYQYSQQLITHDTKNNIYDYKHTYCVDLLPITKNSLICLPKKVAQQMGNINQFVICLRITNVVWLIDPTTLQIAEVSSSAYYKNPFKILCEPKNLIEFYVLEVEEIVETKRAVGHGQISIKHTLADVWVVQSNHVGRTDVQPYCCKTHLGRWLSPGDNVLGYDLVNSNLNNLELDSLKADQIPDVVLVCKSFDRAKRAKSRKWKLKRLYKHDENGDDQNEFISFMEDIEEDKIMREKINIYKDLKNNKNSDVESIITSTDIENDLSDGPTLDEMLDDLNLNNDVEMTE